ncbi:glutamine amidotransferase-related protein [Pelagibacterium limicola]|uniref:glutamine amidotransferase-related protein n=1 Tax=Pelagibacterium limicola TaxID=2791022 RepID=UPI001FE67FE7|nr:type 1 glutamine amidotransferase [Pelagibacterium limicola]
MKLTILKTGEVPSVLAGRFPAYTDMFRAMFERDGARFDFEVIDVPGGPPLPDPADLEAVLVTGSPAGVYDNLPWLDPVRDFVRKAYARRLKLVGICFGHQIIADALGGVVQKSEKGWGLGRHTYRIEARPRFFDLPRASVSIACSHQDQVIAPPAEARLLLSSDFTPNAGLLYGNGTTLTFQPHPEFEDSYTSALIDLRHGQAPDTVLDAAHVSMAKPSDSPLLARAISRFLTI